MPEESPTGEQLAKLFHATYERLAPEYGYKTRKESAKPWDEVPDQNKRLMIATCEHVLSILREPRLEDVLARKRVRPARVKEVQ